MNFTKESIEALSTTQEQLAALSFLKNVELAMYDAEGNKVGAYSLYRAGLVAEGGKLGRFTPNGYEPVCNFLPYMTREIILDDGKKTVHQFGIAALHESGVFLPEVIVPSQEFASMNWLADRWGACCNIEPGTRNKEIVRYAIQSTEQYAVRERRFSCTGWKELDGDWIYLMPGGEYDVSLPGKLAHYSLEDNGSEDAIAHCVELLRSNVAPKPILHTLFALAALSPLNEFFKHATHEPKLIVALCGKTGSKKSTLAALFLSFFGWFTGVDLPATFRDTGNSIIANAGLIKDAPFVVDDYHPSGRYEEQIMRTIAQMLVRAYGDRAGRNRLNRDASLKTATPPQGNCLITAEEMPDVTESGLARCIQLELHQDDVDLAELTKHQEYAKAGDFRTVMARYVAWIAEQVSTEELQRWFCMTILDSMFEAGLEDNRQHLKEIGVFHDRLPENIAWLSAGATVFALFLQGKGYLSENEAAELAEEMEASLRLVAESQMLSARRQEPADIVVDKLRSMLDCNRLTLLSKNASTNDVKPTCGFEDEEHLYFNAEILLREIRRMCDEQGEVFPFKVRTMLSNLKDAGIIVPGESAATQVVHLSGKPRRVAVLKKSAVLF